MVETASPASAAGPAEPVAATVRYANLNGATNHIAGNPDRTGSESYQIFNVTTHVLVDRDGIVRDFVLAALNAAEIVRHAEVILAQDEAA